MVRKPEKTAHAKLQPFITFCYPKNGHVYPVFYENRYFRLFDFSKLKTSPFGHLHHPWITPRHHPWIKKISFRYMVGSEFGGYGTSIKIKRTHQMQECYHSDKI